MTYRNKYRIVAVVSYASLATAAYGYVLLRGELIGGQNTIPGKIMLFGSVIVGVAATTMRYYYKPRQEDSDDQRLAMETLAAIAKQREAEKHLPVPKPGYKK